MDYSVYTEEIEHKEKNYKWHFSLEYSHDELIQMKYLMMDLNSIMYRTIRYYLGTIYEEKT